jgi:oligoendopeptidase F
MAQVGALQLWRNARLDEKAALSAYRHALQLGGTVTLPQLFEAAGTQFRFDAEMLGELVQLAETTIAQLRESL